MNKFAKKLVLIALIAATILPISNVALAADVDKPMTDILPSIVTESNKQGETATGEAQTTGETATTQATTTTANTATAEQPKVAAETQAQTTSVPATTGQISNGTRVAYSAMLSSIRKYAAVNPEVRGWLYITNTNINMPILKPNGSNLYYEKRTWDNVYYPNNNYSNYKETATFTDRRVVLGDGWDRSSKNIVIYGHNWNNLRAPYVIGNNPKYTMFAQLPSYTSIDFAKKNPYIHFSTDQNEGVWKIFSVAYIENDPSVFMYNTPNPSPEAYARILSELKQRSLFNFGVDVNTNDHIITLDTCTRNYANVGGQQRFIVVARLLRPGETDTQGVSIEPNPNVKRPKF